MVEDERIETIIYKISVGAELNRLDKLELVKAIQYLLKEIKKAR